MAEPNDTRAVKTCTSCKREKPATREHFNKKLDGLTPMCRACRSASRSVRNMSKADRAAHNAKRRAKRAEKADEIRRKERERYAADPTKKRASAAAYRRRNPDAVKAARQRYYENNKDEFIRKVVERDKANPEAKRQRLRDWYHKKRKHEISYRVRRAISANIYFSLRNGKEGCGWESLVGYTLSELMVHLEKQFAKGMSWSNYGEWHIDHITPVSAFNITSIDCEDFRHCWCLTNLRPLWAKENILKRATRTHLI